MGIQRAIVTNKKKKKGKGLKTPPHNLLSNDQVSDFRSSQLLSFLHFFEEHPCGLLCAWFSDASTGSVNSQTLFNLPYLCNIELGGFTDMN